MKLRNSSHKDDAWILLHFHWVRKELGIPRNNIALLVTKTKSASWCALCEWFAKASWRGKWRQYLGFGNKIMVKVTDGGRGETLAWIRGFAHEIWHTTGASESECKAKEDWIQKRWEKRNG